MIPDEKVEARFGSWPIFETITPLAGNATASLGSEFDVVDLIRATHDGAAFAGGATGYTVDPAASAAFFFLYWSMYAEGAAGIPVAGELIILGRGINPATGAAGGTALVLGRVVMPGIIIQPGIETAKRLHHGRMSLGGARFISGIYRNAPVAQTIFQLGVYLRAV